MNDIWNKYEKIMKISSGPYANIIKAKEKKTGKYVAIKELKNPKYKNIKEFLTNVKIMELNKLENSVDIIETFETKDNFYIIMELCLINLEEYIKIKNKGLSIEEIKEILHQINIILKNMQNKDININIKPSNILITIDKNNRIIIKLSDFGLDKNKDENLSMSSLGNINLVLSPEEIERGKNSIKSDIWSLGIIIYYMLFNEYPYKGDTEFQLNNDIHSNKKLKKIDNKELDDLISKMLIIDFNKRISWNDYFNHSFFKNYINQQNLKFPNLNFENIINQKIQFRCKDCLNLVLFGILYENLEVKIESRCRNGHYNIEKVEEFYNRNLLNPLSSMLCSTGNEKQNKNNELLYCNECNKCICMKHLKEHKHNKNISLLKLDNYCIEHKEKIISFCKKCSINLCNNCLQNHINHNLINIDSIKLNNKQINEYEIKIKESEINYNNFMIQVKNIYDEFLKYQIEFINSVQKFIKLNQTQILICKTLINNYKEMDKKNNLNYEIINNIINILKFKPIECEIDKNFHILPKIQKYYSTLSNNFNCILQKSNYWINIDYKITKEEKNYLLTQFKPLDGNNLEFIEKYDDGSGDYYYGEIIRKSGDIKKKGRGIRLYLNGEKDFGYFDNMMNGYSIEFYKDGSFNQGNKNNGADDGFQIYKSSDGLIIKNFYDKGLKNGFEVSYYPNGDIIINEYKNNISKGYYVKYSSNGEKYEGEVKYGNKNGIGIKTTFRSVYEGEWKNDNEEGIGRIIWNYPKEKYEGEFKHNNFHGFGIYSDEKGIIMYKGEYENHLKHGYGIDYHSNGKIGYEGFYKNGNASGFGVCYLQDGYRFYIGYLDNGERNGFGIYKDKPNLKMIGYWKDDQIFNGHYVRFNSDGSSYKGFAKNGKFYGYGIYKFYDGEIYEGEWVNDQSHGYGIYKYNDGRIYKGEWKNDKKEGYGEELIPGITTYKGEWKNDEKEGYGMESFGNSNKYEYGIYKNGNLIEEIVDV